MKTLLALAYSILAVVALSGAVQNAVDSAWHAPFPFAMMLGVGAMLAGLAGAWLMLRSGGRITRAYVAGGSALGVLIGGIGVWGTWLIAVERCSGPTAASLAASLPPDYCSATGPSLLIGIYLIGIGAVSTASLLALWRIDDGRPQR